MSSLWSLNQEVIEFYFWLSFWPSYEEIKSIIMKGNKNEFLDLRGHEYYTYDKYITCLEICSHILYEIASGHIWTQLNCKTIKNATKS